LLRKQDEAVPESLKNILLVMADGGYLAPPTKDPSKETIWVETQKRLDRFLPNLFAEIFPPQEAQPEEAAASEPTETTEHESGPAAEDGDSAVEPPKKD
jgi:brefeldin A-resistance guanine nucleotide exchange factor 1